MADPGVRAGGREAPSSALTGLARFRSDSTGLTPWASVPRIDSTGQKKADGPTKGVGAPVRPTEEGRPQKTMARPTVYLFPGLPRERDADARCSLSIQPRCLPRTAAEFVTASPGR